MRMRYRDSRILATEKCLWTESTASSPRTTGGMPVRGFSPQGVEHRLIRHHDGEQAAGRQALRLAAVDVDDVARGEAELHRRGRAVAPLDLLAMANVVVRRVEDLGVVLRAEDGEGELLVH